MTERCPIAIIGLGSWFPGASSPQTLWENLLAKRVEFRRYPSERMPLKQYFDLNDKDKITVQKGAFIDGFNFDYNARRITRSVFEVTDIVHWLALEVALQALQDAGYLTNKKDGQQKFRETTGVIIGNTMVGEQSRSFMLRFRWPYIKAALSAACEDEGFSTEEIEHIALVTEKYFKSMIPEPNEDSLAGNLSNTIAGRVANYLDLHGGAYTVDGACASSLIAVMEGAVKLASGALDMVICGGVDVSQDPFEVGGFSRVGVLSQSGIMNPFDATSTGFLLGEGCAMVVMKRLDDALRDGDYIYAVLRGWGMSSDGSGGLITPKAVTQALAIQRCYAKAGLSFASLNFVECHGTGTKRGDVVELTAIGEALQASLCDNTAKGNENANNDNNNNNSENSSSCINSNDSRAGNRQTDKTHRIAVSSIKSNIGHAKAAAGVAGFLKAVLAVNQRVIPPTCNVVQPNAIFHTNPNLAKYVYPLTEVKVFDSKCTLRGGVSAFGFGGINVHVAVESGPYPPKALLSTYNVDQLRVSYQTTELFAFSAPSAAALADKVANYLTLIDGAADGELVDIAAFITNTEDEEETKTEGTATRFTFRVALVAESVEALQRKLRSIAEMSRTGKLPEPGGVWADARQQVYISHDVAPLRVGFLYPGQGSVKTYIDFGSRLWRRFPEFRKLLTQADEWLRECHCAPISSYFLNPEEDSGDTELGTEISQPCIVFHSILWTNFLRNVLGIEPHVVGGHSLGEISAFYAAGWLSAKEALQLAALRGKSMHLNSGRMIALNCTKEEAATLLQQLTSKMSGETIAIANLNHPTQVVVSGTTQSIQQLATLAQSMNVKSTILHVREAFHCALMQPAAEQFLRDIQHYNVLSSVLSSSAPQKPTVYSSMLGNTEVPLQKPTDIAKHFAMHIVSSVDFDGMVRRMISSQSAQYFVEVGPGSVLSRLVTKIASGMEAVVDDTVQCLPLESTAASDVDLNVALAHLYCRHSTVRSRQLRALFTHRLVRPFVPARQRSFIVNVCATDFSVEEAAPSSRIEEIPSVSASSGIIVTSGAAVETTRSVIPTSTSTVGTSDTFHISEGATAKAAEFAVPSERDIVQYIVGLIAERTGYKRETIELRHRLLDDLNLDSIKSGELIVDIARHYKMEGLDVSEHSNASIEEIAFVIQRYYSRNRLLHAQKSQRNLLQPQSSFGHLQRRLTSSRNLHALVTSLNAPATASNKSSQVSVSKEVPTSSSKSNIPPSSIPQSKTQPQLQSPSSTTESDVASSEQSLPPRAHPVRVYVMKPAPIPSWMLAGGEDVKETVSSQLGDVVRKRVQLEFGTTISELRWTALPVQNATESRNEASSLSKGHVEVTVMSVGLNFRDVLYASQRYPALKAAEGEPHWHGCGSGVISAVRNDETTWRVGQAVFGILCHPFATHTVTDSALLLPKPEWLSFDDAATLPTCYFAAYHALITLAQVSSNDTVLIHSATGALGLAAVQIALMRGARVIATVGSDDKADYLRRVFGLEYVFSSRNQSFVDNVLRVTQNAGVDVILNSLAGDLMTANFHLLRPYGRFVEVGTRNIYNKTINLSPLRQNVAYFVLDTMSMFHSRPEVIRHTLEEVIANIQRGHLRPLPFQRFSRSNVQEAFYRVASGTHIGKIVLTLPDVAVILCTEEEQHTELFQAIQRLLQDCGYAVRLRSLPSSSAEPSASVLHSTEECTLLFAILPPYLYGGAQLGFGEKHSVQTGLTQLAQHLLAVAQSAPKARDSTSQHVADPTSIKHLFVLHRRPRELLGVNSAGIASFVKSVQLERPTVRVHLLEAPHDVDSLSSWIATVAREVERQLRNKGLERVIQHVVFLPETNVVPPASGSPPVQEERERSLQIRTMAPELLEPWRLPMQPEPGNMWTPQDVILVTGGAKGITAACAMEFATRTRVQLVLCGRNAAQTAEIQGALQRFAQCGLCAEYRQCDVTSAESTAALIEYCVQKYGSHFSGVIHGAGVNIPARAVGLTQPQILQQLLPKVAGYLNLWKSIEALQAQHHLKLFVCLSSIIGAGGFEGAAWYALSNEVMDFFVEEYARKYPHCRSLALGYCLWDEIGMVTQHHLTKPMMNKYGMAGVRPQDGAATFVDLVLRPLPHPRVIVTSRNSNDATMFLENNNLKAHPLPAHCRYLKRVLYLEPGVECVVAAELSLSSDPYLRDHCVDGTVLLPAMLGLEAMAQTVAYVLGVADWPRHLRVERTSFKSPVIIPQQGSVTLIIHAEVWQDTITATLYSNTSFQREQFQAVFSRESSKALGTPQPMLPVSEVRTLRPLGHLRMTGDVYGGSVPGLFHGPDFQVVRQLYADSWVDMQQQKGRLIAQLDTTNITAKVNGATGYRYLFFDPFLFDGVLQCCVLLAAPHRILPVTFQLTQLTDIRIPTPPAFVVVTLNERDGDLWKFSFQLLSSEGQMLYVGDAHLLQRATLRAESVKVPTLNTISFDVSAVTTHLLTEHELFSTDSLRQFVAQHALSLSSFVILMSIPYLHKCGKEERHVIERRLLHHIIQEHREVLHSLNIQPQDVESLSWHDNGKPYFSNRSNLFISFSHCHNTLLAALSSNSLVACDLEVLRAYNKSVDDWVAMIQANNTSQLLQFLGRHGYSTDDSGLVLWTVKECIIKACGVSLQNVQLSIVHASSTQKTVLFRAVLPPSNEKAQAPLHILTTTLNPARHPLIGSDSVVLSLTLPSTGSLATSFEVAPAATAATTASGSSLPSSGGNTIPFSSLELSNGVPRQKKGALVAEFTTANTILSVVNGVSQQQTAQSLPSSQGHTEKLLESLAEQHLRQFLERNASVLPNSYSLCTKYFKAYTASTSSSVSTAPPSTNGMGRALHIALFLQQVAEGTASFLVEVYLLGKGGVRRKAATAWMDVSPCSESSWFTLTLPKLKSISLSNNGL